MIIGEWAEERDIRDQLFIATKVHDSLFLLPTETKADSKPQRTV
jgi:aryl-alcohol dehydrogenase-like predicted oxidoreductase